MPPDRSDLLLGIIVRRIGKSFSEVKDVILYSDLSFNENLEDIKKEEEKIRASTKLMFDGALSLPESLDTLSVSHSHNQDSIPDSESRLPNVIAVSSKELETDGKQFCEQTDFPSPTDDCSLVSDDCESSMVSLDAAIPVKSHPLSVSSNNQDDTNAIGCPNSHFSDQSMACKPEESGCVVAVHSEFSTISRDLDISKPLDITLAATGHHAVTSTYDNSSGVRMQNVNANEMVPNVVSTLEDNAGAHTSKEVIIEKELEQKSVRTVFVLSGPCLIFSVIRLSCVLIHQGSPKGTPGMTCGHLWFSVRCSNYIRLILHQIIKAIYI